MSADNVSHQLKYLQRIFLFRERSDHSKSNNVKEIKQPILQCWQPLIVCNFVALRCSSSLAHNLQSACLDLVDCQEVFGQFVADELVVVRGRLRESDSLELLARIESK